MAALEQNAGATTAEATSAAATTTEADEVALKYLAGPPPDNATPEELLDYILWMIEDQQLFKAKACLDRLEAHPDLAEGSSSVEGLVEARGLPTYKVGALRKYVEESEKAKSEFDNDDGWELAQDLFGVKTYWKMEPGERAIYTKMEGDLQDLSLVCLASTLREIDLYSTWLPFCIMSDITQWKGRCDVLCHFGIQVPFMYRDCYVHAFLCDTIYDDGSFMLVGGSPGSFMSSGPDSEDVEAVTEYGDVELKPCDKSWNASWGSAARMDVKAFSAQFTQLSENTVRARVVTCIDPSVPLPMPIINFCVKHIAGVVLSLLAAVARRIQNHPEKSEHAARIRTDPFYSGFLIPKCDRVYDAKGWKRTELFQKQAGAGDDDEVERLRRDGEAAAAEADGWFGGGAGAVKGLVGATVGVAGGVWGGVKGWFGQADEGAKAGEAGVVRE